MEIVQKEKPTITPGPTYRTQTQLLSSIINETLLQNHILKMQDELIMTDGLVVRMKARKRG